jgi:hypothetical protein
MTEKERKARELANELSNQNDTDVTVDQISRWRDDEVYDWLELGWDFEWDGEEWKKV